MIDERELISWLFMLEEDATQEFLRSHEESFLGEAIGYSVTRAKIGKMLAGKDK